MNILFVCTGNICRSPMGELLWPRFITDPNIQARSAGTYGLDGHAIAEHSRELMERDGIDPSAFRSRRLTREIAANADLILCFEREQRGDIVTLAPNKVRRTFLLPDFANAAAYCAKERFITGATVADRLESVIDNASLARPMLPQVDDVPDPQGKDMQAFERAHASIVADLRTIADAVR